MLSFGDLLINIILKYKEKYSKSLSKTKLLKLAYLAEVFYFRKFRERMADIHWIYFKYGPWSSDYDEILNSYPFKIEVIQFEDDKEAMLIDVDSGYKYEQPLPFDSQLIISKAIFEFGSLELKKILDYVYFDTEPMMAAQERGQKLSFDEVKGEAYYKIKSLKIDPKIKLNIIKKYKEKIKNARRM